MTGNKGRGSRTRATIEVHYRFSEVPFFYTTFIEEKKLIGQDISHGLDIQQEPCKKYPIFDDLG